MTVGPRNFRSLKVWEKAHFAALSCCRETQSFPKDELYGLTTQIRRAGSSVPANIAEGCGRGGKELPRFCRISMGSASELEYHLLLAHDLKILGTEPFQALSAQVVKVKPMLSEFIDKIVADG
jgi:four helix bundle protein